ncbi:MAG TPA: YiiX/YebB-like N1pC/P60 family cysteine hydrolase [Thermoanaerobaculia bacterium]
MRPWVCLLFCALALGMHADDAQLIATYRAGMHSLIREAGVPAAKVPSRDEREEARAVWKSFLDYQLALETIRERHRGFPKLKNDARAREFRLYHAAWLAQYRAALDFVARMEQHPELHTMLNESVPSLGLDANTYAAFKLHWLHVKRAAEFGAFALLDRTLGGTPLAGSSEDAKAILAAGAGRGSMETVRNAARVVGEAAWNPLPTAIAAAADSLTSPAPRPSFISRPQLQKTRALLAPGDLLFERRDWALTNVGLPGFWPHVALYVGSPEERRALFGEAFEERLRARDAKRYAELARAAVIEAVSENVVLSTFEHSADADYLAVIRPRVDLAAKAEAIERAFAMVGRPYDFEFDFVTDDRIVCSELVYKAYEQKLDLPVMRYAGRAVTPPNDFVRWFDEHYDSPGRRADFVAFLDGHAHLKAAREEDVAALRKSWRRPRWHPVAHRD